MLRALVPTPIFCRALFPLEDTLVFAFLRADSVDCFDRLGVVIKFSTDELLSLSVGYVDIKLSLAVPAFPFSPFDSLPFISLMGLI